MVCEMLVLESVEPLPGLFAGQLELHASSSRDHLQYHYQRDISHSLLLEQLHHRLPQHHDPNLTAGMVQPDRHQLPPLLNKLNHIINGNRPEPAPPIQPDAISLADGARVFEEAVDQHRGNCEHDLAGSQ